MPSISPVRARRAPFPAAVLGPIVALLASCSGGSGPEPSGLLRVAADDLDGPAGGIATSGFDVDDVSSFRVQVNRGPTIVRDTTIVRSGPLAYETDLRPDTYVVLVETFQGGDVLQFTGAGQATVLADDTVDAAVDLDPALGNVAVTIGDASPAVVATNGTAPLRLTVLNSRGQPVPGAALGLSVSPSGAAEIEFSGAAETRADGTFEAVLDPAGVEGDGEIRLTVDGFPVQFPSPARFSVVSPVDVDLSSIELANAVRLPADGASKADITVSVVDVGGVPQAGIPVEVHSSRNGPGGLLDTIRVDRDETDGTGVVRATLQTTSSSTLAGDAVITVTADSKELTRTGLVTFRSIVSAGDTEISVFPQVVPANGAAAAEITVTVGSTNGTPASDVLVQIETKDNSLFSIQPAQGRTNGQGVFRSRISSTVKTGTVIDVIADGLRTSATGFVLFN